MPNPTTPIPGLIGLLGQQILDAIVVDVEKRLAIFVDRGDFQACLDLEYGNPVEQDASVCVLLQMRCLGGRHPPNTAAVKQ
jgi:hypothetical protein